MNLHDAGTRFKRHVQTHSCCTAYLWVEFMSNRNLDESPIDYVRDRRLRSKRLSITCVKKVEGFNCLIVSPTACFEDVLHFLNHLRVEQRLLVSTSVKFTNKTCNVLPLCFPKSNCLPSTKNLMYIVHIEVTNYLIVPRQTVPRSCGWSCGSGVSGFVELSTSSRNREVVVQPSGHDTQHAALEDTCLESALD